ncbi:50S ribosomal protein L25/general stress protein Ctc [Sporolactobacillus shoreae]|uniref:Large ribosomal subunit protein bL25 n=1 Tax=Sporolactobacillus shoreae TaxID=1465501 RepID=A0A4Z0GKC5_9BACL|nr:50S ribosomal protein L25/general stress protein Ctc [Sporolactobacillus shoreae]TGA96525.1 50S ribosomal protein L25/general stress protein Ctc [Sporolactobacillus shoreae]
MATLNAAIRDDSKKSIAKKLRREGQIPSVVYGKTATNESIAVNAGEINKMFRDEGRNAIITLNIDDKKKYTVMAHELQFNNLKGTIQHIDFLQINMNEAIDAVVPVVLKGAEIVEVGEVVVNNQLSELTVNALPANLPNSIEIDVSKLTVGDSIRISDIAPEADYKILGEPEEVVVSVSYSGKSAEEEPAASEEEAAAKTDKPAE